jgi:hypothetical protein
VENVWKGKATKSNKKQQKATGTSGAGLWGIRNRV